MTSERGPGHAPELVEWKLRPPSIRPGIVARPALVDFLEAQPVPLICVVAPPGYGKTTLLAQWAERRDGRVGWVSVDKRDNDPVMLLTSIAAALDRLEPIDAAVFRSLGAPSVSALTTAVPRLVSAVSAMTGPAALVLDHVEQLENQECLDAVAELALALPTGSRVVLAARHTHTPVAGGPAAGPWPDGRGRGRRARDGPAGGQGAARGGRGRAVRGGAGGPRRAGRRVAGGAVPGRPGPQGR
jgi:LuxR family transcriptional regulator, maltose regulon positive regulatory protein